MPPSPAILAAVDARLKAKQQGLPPPDLAPYLMPAQPEADPVLASPEPAFSSFFPSSAGGSSPVAIDQPQAVSGQPASYVMKGSAKPPVADLVAQGEQWADGVRQTEWWASVLAMPDATLHLFDDYEAAMGDPVFREVRRAALIGKLRGALRDASLQASAGDEDHARLKLQHAATYQRQIEAIDRGDYARSR